MGWLVLNGDKSQSQLRCFPLAPRATLWRSTSQARGGGGQAVEPSLGTLFCFKIEGIALVAQIPGSSCLTPNTLK